MLNERPASLVVRGVLQPGHYIALARMGRVYEQPLRVASRYLLGRGQYPYTMRVQTPCGIQELTLFSGHDAMTVHEVFCREVYRCAPPAEVIVDLGSNVGISALYFLTRSPTAYCDLYEPDPRNTERLRQNLRAFNGRFTLHEVGVADKDGSFEFIREASGRYGSFKTTTWLGLSPEKRHETDRIEVRVEHINTVLERAVSSRGQVDLLKIDTEGYEVDILRAIDPLLLRR